MERDGEGAPEVGAAALSAAWAFLTTLTSDTPRPQVTSPAGGGVSLRWAGGGRWLRVTFAPDGHLSELEWRHPATVPAPGWARGALARAMHRVR